jgi:hypothetical protein
MKSPGVLSAVLRPFPFLVILGAVAGTLRAADPPGGNVLFEENFAEPPDQGWSWLNEIPNRWKTDKQRKELLISPVWSTGNLKNILLRAVPDGQGGPLAIEAHLDHVPTGDYEYAGLIWYFDDKDFVTIRKGPHGDDGKTLSVKRVKGEEIFSHKPVIYNEPSVDLRLIVTDGKAQGWYRAASTDKWQLIGEVEMSSRGAAKVGFRTGNGDGPKPSWARFSKFRILQLDR